MPVSKLLAASALRLCASGAILASVAVQSMPAHAMPVFDASNYAQNLLIAARTLEQINNQIQSLQNDASMLTNMAKNLSRIDFPQLDQIQQRLQEIERLMGEAEGIEFKVDQLDEKFRRLFPDAFDRTLRSDERVREARARLETSMDAFQHTMRIQSQVVENVSDDAQALSAIIGRSQGAEGSLQAQQATNQLLALTAKQQFQLQQLMAAQFRSEAIEQARRVHEGEEARAATSRFLGTGQAYTPQ
jgi:type IV secretion system protein TrbJ